MIFRESKAQYKGYSLICEGENEVRSLRIVGVNMKFMCVTILNQEDWVQIDVDVCCP